MGGCVGQVGVFVWVWVRVVLWYGFDCVWQWWLVGEGHRSGGGLGENEVRCLGCCCVPLCVVMGDVGGNIHVPTGSVSACCVLLVL